MRGKERKGKVKRGVVVVLSEAGCVKVTYLVSYSTPSYPIIESLTLHRMHAY
ncbi:hypothetical protein BofuT4_P048860.1 [Botrytis cinerea T4]|uniref:Uncharacterized protein n=1 Tax=Botryotinia fuckeliana (strain T4) TaxID=999810 RepID=G2XZI1_BOTF4|nr:hypothetical protein BofuT4_P048860.1 [Botrytis cinerea T4]